MKHHHRVPQWPHFEWRPGTRDGYVTTMVRTRIDNRRPVTIHLPGGLTEASIKRLATDAVAVLLHAEMKAHQRGRTDE